MEENNVQVNEPNAANQSPNTPTPDKVFNLNFSQVSFNFYGKAGEFWQIWIVNVLLTILTLGIYSAWAKVRTERYFYGNTELDGHRFRYLATPLQVLKGRVIAVVLFASYYLLSTFYPLVGALMALTLAILFPFLICASLRFNMRVSSYRNVRFDFKGQYGDAFVNFLLLPILSIFTLYLALPWVLKRIDEFLVSNTYYGDKQFQPELETGTYYLASLITIGVSILFVFCAAFVIGFLGVAIPQGEAMKNDPTAMFAFMAVFTFVYVFLIVFVSAFYTSMIRNHIFANTELDGVAKFESNFSVFSLAWLQVSNYLLIIVTFGLAFPLAKIRRARYVVDKTNVSLSSEKESVIDHLGEQQSAIGDEVANVFDVDIALT